MSVRRPFIRVSVNGAPVSGLFYSLLSSATIHDAPGQESDSVELKFDDPGGTTIPLPGYGARISVTFGYEGSGGAKMGLFVYERSRIEGGAGGEFVLLSGRSADRRSDVKETGSEHFDDMTVGGIVQELAGRHGHQAIVDAQFGSIQLPYLARVNQSAADLLTRLADRVGAQFAVKDGKFLFLKRGQLQPITIDKSDCSDWSFEVEPRPRHGEIEAAWFDRAAGETKIESHSTGLEGPLKRLRGVFNSAEEARLAAGSEGDRLGRATGSGSLSMEGRPDIMADQPLVTTGFKPEENGEWRVAGVDHSFDGKYTTEISLEAPEGGKE